MKAHAILKEIGGVGGARFLANAVARATGYSVTVRDIRDVFRNYGGGVRKLGAGYYATRDAEAIPVREWVVSNLDQTTLSDLELVVEAVLNEYPHGDRAAVLGWYYQFGPETLLGSTN